MKIALCQLAATENKTDNLLRAKKMLETAKSQEAELAILPEMFCIKYKNELVGPASEPCEGGSCFKMLSDAAKELSMTIIGGSIPEKDGNHIYNTSMAFSKSGSFIGKYRKAHLFDVDLPGYRFCESDTITKGNNTPLIINEPIRTGIAICFDIRFPEWARMIMNEGCDLMVLPAAFARATGPRHWELLLRARALDNQLFVAAVAPATSESSYGHSMLVSPDGKVIADLGEEETVGVFDIPIEELDIMRSSIPIKTARRLDLYKL